jgi:putative addiction module component (TIGR02574 family)
MTKSEILEELRKLPANERQEIRLELAELDGHSWLDEDDPLTHKEKALLEARLVDIESHPEKSIPWDEARQRIEERFGK